ncbi:hypothetical protein J4573_16595 [Actinomadura barringtoniae]|uniref:Uncharacterized protein n=1 Tax=Actinomadura barringtoniae TaxID=1427535 RepID=A0A939PA95_9ACTN|nr:hypothetical protein [Actinomadura barringtoniae]MBO2448723.1 hypothetical protein [Actinomadura barringtoniae]
MSGSSVISELEDEWDRLREDPETGRVFEEIQRVEPVLGELTDLAELVVVMAARGRVEDLDRHDEILLALLRQARVRSKIGDLAARVVLQLLLPGLKRLFGHPYVAALSPDERRAALVAAVWEEIRSPRSTWKPTKVCAQVLGRARGRVRPPRGFAATVTVEPFGDAVPEPAGGRSLDPSERLAEHAGVEVLRVLAEAVADGLISQDQAQLIVRADLEGEPVTALAARLGISVTAAAGRLRRARASLVVAARRSVPGDAGDRGERRRGSRGGSIPR